jgi:hypothetical protein
MRETSASATLLSQYHAGLEAEIALLGRLETIATRQLTAAEEGDLPALGIAIDERDEAMSALVTIEHELKPIRQELASMAESLRSIPEFEAVAALHRHAAQRVASIVSGDGRAMEALQAAERARRFAMQTLEQGESTLAAYRRVVAPSPTHAALFSRRG